jgi:flagellum-specific peptidoglycan hydrolase FlgJ
MGEQAAMNELQSIFLKNAVPGALQSQRETGIPASITIAQAILESSNKLGWGQSYLARKYNNYFGIKAIHGAMPDSYVELETPEVVHGKTVVELARFARYLIPADSFKAHGRLLSISARYAPAMAVRNDPAQFAAQLQKCGYSTNPNYAQALMKLVAEFDLTQYDVPQATSPAMPAEG